MREHCGWGSTALHYTSTGSQTRNVISWSQCILSVYQTAGNFATFRHVSVETHAFVLQNPRWCRTRVGTEPALVQNPRWSYSRVGAPSAPQLSTVQAQAHRPHCRSTVPVCAFGLPDGRQNWLLSDIFCLKITSWHTALERPSNLHATCERLAYNMRATCANPHKPDKTTYCAAVC